MPAAERLKMRYEKFRAHGHFLERGQPSGRRKPGGTRVPPPSSWPARRLRPERSVLYPLTFQPIFKERIWGGRNWNALRQETAARCAHRRILGDQRPARRRKHHCQRPAGGKDLHWLMQEHARELLGARAGTERFPLLIKILDAREKLSLQVHPPASQAAELGGEPKTEMWYIAHAAPGAELFVGLKRGVTRAEFEKQNPERQRGRMFPPHSRQAGDAMFLPSGRVHAIGADS